MTDRRNKRYTENTGVADCIKFFDMYCLFQGVVDGRSFGNIFYKWNGDNDESVKM